MLLVSLFSKSFEVIVFTNGIIETWEEKLPKGHGLGVAIHYMPPEP